MNRLFKSLTTVALGLFAVTAIASPKLLITHNTTDVESNAYIAGTIPSQHPTRPHSDGKLFWAAVRMACFGHTENGKCTALIKMLTNTPNPVDIGTVNVDLDSGDITPKQLSGNGYTITVNGPGETTLTKD